MQLASGQEKCLPCTPPSLWVGVARERNWTPASWLCQRLENYKRLQACLGVMGEGSKGREERGGIGNHYGVFREHPAKGWGEDH